MNLEQLYRLRCSQRSAINEHLPTLREYAAGCSHVTEFGVQGGISTTALVWGQAPIVVSYDVAFDCRLMELCDVLEFVGSSSTTMVFGAPGGIWYYKLCNSVQADTEPTDLLFIDSAHTYLQLRSELANHHYKVRRWIILHDTVSFGEFSEGWQDIENPSKEQKQGLSFAIAEFLDEHKEWKIKQHFVNNNGLTVLERV